MDNFREKCDTLRQLISVNKARVYEILSDIQPKKVTDYEIDRSINTLHAIRDDEVFCSYSIENISVFLPSNLPLYSLILFGVMPSFMTRNYLYLKPNTEMRANKTIERLCMALQIDTLFANIRIISVETNFFVQELVPKSNIVIFTGCNRNRDKILALMQSDSLLIYNGSGHNPIVVGRDADIVAASRDTCFARFFNSGQDCAGPDAILVHVDVYATFLSQFLDNVAALHVGGNADEMSDVGPIHRKIELQKFVDLIYAAKPDEIKVGGIVDVKNRIVQPTVIVRDINSGANYNEVFGPIAFIHVYRNDAELHGYFNDHNGIYQKNKMYVSLYGSNDYLESRNDNFLDERNGVGIILKSKNVHDYERGNIAYGGYSIGASGVIIKNGKSVVRNLAMPIYIPEVIAMHVRGELFHTRVNAKNVNGIYSRISEQFRVAVRTIFGNNLVFGFIFGSVAKRRAQFASGHASDLDTFVCLHSRDARQEERYMKWLLKVQWAFGLNPDFDYNCEIISYTQIEKSIAHLRGTCLNLNFNNEHTFDAIFCLCVLADRKMAMVGDSKCLSALTALAHNELKQLLVQVKNLLYHSPVVNRKMLLSGKSCLDHQKTALHYLDSLYQKREYASIIEEFLPLGGHAIRYTQDDLNFQLNTFYVKKHTRKFSV